MQKEYSATIENTVYPVIFSDEKEILLAAKASGRATLGLWDRNRPDALPTDILYLVEEESQITQDFLERLVRRHLHLPWEIAKTRRLRIREFTIQDWEALPSTFSAAKQLNSPWESCPAIFADKDAFCAYLHSQYAFYEYGIWALEEKTECCLIGGCGFWDGDCGETQIGYWIGPAFQRKGYASEALRAVLAYAEQTGKMPLYAEIREENIPSRKLAEKFNFILRSEQSEARRLRYQYAPYY